MKGLSCIVAFLAIIYFKMFYSTVMSSNGQFTQQTSVNITSEPIYKNIKGSFFPRFINKVHPALKLIYNQESMLTFNSIQMREDLAQAQFKSARNMDMPSYERTKRSAKRHVFKHIKYELNKDNLLNLKTNKMQYSDQTFDAI